MHTAKARGKARHEIFGRDMHGELMSRLKMETDLRRACERDELFVDYQPIVSRKSHFDRLRSARAMASSGVWTRAS